MNKLKYILSFVFILTIAAAVTYYVTRSSNEGDNTVNSNITDTTEYIQKDFASIRNIASSGFFDEFENFLSGYEEETNKTDEKNKLDHMPSIGEVLGSIQMPSISLSSALVYGDGSNELSIGVGIDQRQKIPGQGGNVILAGHNNMAFGALGGLKVGDEVILNTSYGAFKYKVETYRVTQYDDLTVIVSKDQEYLTMYTCYPFDVYTPTPTRYVVTCTYVGKE